MNDPRISDPVIYNHRKRSCWGKVKHSTRENAQIQAKIINTKDPTARVITYNCRYCSGFHNGTKIINRQPQGRIVIEFIDELGIRAASLLAQENTKYRIRNFFAIKNRFKAVFRKIGKSQ